MLRGMIVFLFLRILYTPPFYDGRSARLFPFIIFPLLLCL